MTFACVSKQCKTYRIKQILKTRSKMSLSPISISLSANPHTHQKFEKLSQEEEKQEG